MSKETFVFNVLLMTTFIQMIVVVKYKSIAAMIPLAVIVTITILFFHTNR